MKVVPEAVWASSAAELADLHVQCFPQAWSEAEFASLLTLPGSSAWVCREAGRFVALALFRQAVDEAELLTLATHPDYRRSGHAATILTEGEKALLSQGVGRVFLEVSTANPGALSLYSRAGYGELARRRAYYRDGSDALVLEKWLRKDGQTAL
ncbi:GNAT family N-acetyltransferase [Maricaulis maris]|uniref:GNAT family N-acetyltransferase n=1 Tax=Maricaulis maris TaxID=74318 RepID=UPI003B8E04DF